MHMHNDGGRLPRLLGRSELCFSRIFHVTQNQPPTEDLEEQEDDSSTLSTAAGRVFSALLWMSKILLLYPASLLLLPLLFHFSLTALVLRKVAFTFAWALIWMLKGINLCSACLGSPLDTSDLFGSAACAALCVRGGMRQLANALFPAYPAWVKLLALVFPQAVNMITFQFMFEK